MKELKGFSNSAFQDSLEKVGDSLYGKTKLINSEEAKTLVLLLEQRNPSNDLKTLTSISNLASFTANQVSLEFANNKTVCHKLLFSGL